MITSSLFAPTVPYRFRCGEILMAKAKKKTFRVVFANQGKIYELHAHEVGQSDLYGFVEVSDLVFGTGSSVVVDPAEERMKDEFAGVSSTFIPMHAVMRIDEVEKSGVNKVSALGEDGKVTQFPTPIYTPGAKPD